MSYVDFFCLPLKKGGEAEYKKQSEKFGKFMKAQGMLSYCEAIADDVPRGQVTDFYKAVDMKDGETVVASYCSWPDKKTRDNAWALMMKDPEMNSQKVEDMPFDGKRMFWGGFKPIYEMT